MELLLLSNNMFTLVLVIGEERHKTRVQSAIDDYPFTSSKYRKNKPIVEWFSIGTASKFFGDIDWAIESECNKEVNKLTKHYLNRGKPFVFYRDGALSGVYKVKDYWNAVNEIFELSVYKNF